MLRLTTFDGVALSRDQRPVSGVQNRRHSLSLLLVLAARGTRGISRDALIDLLWPENAVKDPRHSLDQLLSVTRTAVEGAPLISGTSLLRLDADGVHTDVEEFERARLHGRLEEMIALYRSPFADGFGAGLSAPLEQFLSAARTRFAREFAVALQTLGDRAEKSGEFALAAQWYMKLHESDRLDRSVVLQLISCLSSSGQERQALRTARGYVSLLHEEFGREDPELAQWVHRLSTGSSKGGGDSALAAKGAEPMTTNTKGLAAYARHEPAELSLLTRVIGERYRLEQLLRPGRIVSTFLAVDTEGTFGLVEVQVLAAPLAASAPAAHFAEVFRRVKQLMHATILPTLDAGVDGSIRFVVTARRPGESLEHRMQRVGELPLPDALTIAYDTAHALAIAHGAGLRHGDLRPKHIDLSSGGRACVAGLGFGEYALQDVQEAPGSASLVLGSSVYRSPEQLLEAVSIDARSDVYAFGCVLFEMLTGAPPFGRSGMQSSLSKLRLPAPSVRQLRETVTSGLEAVVQRCLARSPADRFQSGEELASALAACRTERGTDSDARVADPPSA